VCARVYFSSDSFLLFPWKNAKGMQGRGNYERYIQFSLEVMNRISTLEANTLESSIIIVEIEIVIIELAIISSFNLVNNR
jgi:hypothetical protein